MSFTTNRLADIKEKIDEQIKGQLDLFKLRLVERSSLTMGFLYTVIFITLLLTFAFLFGSIALVFFINDYLDSKYWGFILMALVYLFIVLILTIICLLRRRPLFTNFFVRWFARIFGANDI